MVKKILVYVGVIGLLLGLQSAFGVYNVHKFRTNMHWGGWDIRNGLVSYDSANWKDLKITVETRSGETHSLNIAGALVEERTFSQRAEDITSVEVGGSFTIVGREVVFLGIPIYIYKGTAEGRIVAASINMDYSDNPAKIQTKLRNDENQEVGDLDVILHFNRNTGNLDWLDISVTYHALGGLNYKK